MKLNINNELQDIYGNTLTLPESEGQAKPMALGFVIQNALLGVFPEDQNMDGSKKLLLYTLATKTLDENSDYTVEELSLIKDRVGRAFGPTVVGPVWGMLDGG